MKMLTNFTNFIHEKITYDGAFNEKKIGTNTNDFIWNEVTTWLVEELEKSDVKFESRYFRGGVVHFDVKGGLSFRCNSESDYNSSRTEVKFSVSSEDLFSYKIQGKYFTDRESFKNVFYNGQYKNYCISGAKVGDE